LRPSHQHPTSQTGHVSVTQYLFQLFFTGVR
jgi:hypothetical protein